MTTGVPRTARPRRWGLWTLAFLTLAAGSILVSNLLVMTSDDGVNDYVLLTFLGTVVGLGGAAVCSVRGLRAWKGFRL